MWLTARSLRPHAPHLLVGCGLGVAALLGLLASSLGGVLVGLLTLLPVVSHVRWVGWRRAIAEPSAMTIILYFYLCVFPQRGFVIATSSYRASDFTLGQVTNTELALTLALASLGTALLIEGFHFARTRDWPNTLKPPLAVPCPASRVTLLAAAFAILALAALGGIIIENHGLANTTAVFFSHSKDAAGEAKSLATSVWAVFAVPAVWCAALVVSTKRTPQGVRVVFLVASAVLVLAQLFVFGSRLSALLAVMGAWMMAHLSGRRVPVAAVLASIPLLLLLSVPIITQRPGRDFAHLPTYERFSRIAAYGVLDASLAVQERPGDIRDRLTDPSRWLSFPLYLVPSPLWPDKPTIDDRRLDVFVAQAVGTQYQQDTGLPTSYITEMRLYGGWLAVLFASGASGFLLGLVDLRLLGSARDRASPSAMIWYCFVITCAFTYYKDGDLLVTTLGQLRTGAYLGIAMLITGVWTLRARRWSVDHGPAGAYGVRGAP